VVELVGCREDEYYFFLIPIKSISEPLLNSVCSPDFAWSFIRTIPSELSMQVRFHWFSFRIAMIFVGTIADSFSLINLLEVDSRSSMSIFISVDWGCICFISSSCIFGSLKGCSNAAILFWDGRKKSSWICSVLFSRSMMKNAAAKNASGFWTLKFL